jgi:hypothetical protein
MWNMLNLKTYCKTKFGDFTVALILSYNQEISCYASNVLVEAAGEQGSRGAGEQGRGFDLVD